MIMSLELPFEHQGFENVSSRDMDELYFDVTESLIAEQRVRFEEVGERLSQLLLGRTAVLH